MCYRATEKTWGNIVMTERPGIVPSGHHTPESWPGRRRVWPCGWGWTLLYTVHYTSIIMHLKLGAAPLLFQSSPFLLGGVDLVIVPLGVGSDTHSLGHSRGVFVQDVLVSSTILGDCYVHVIRITRHTLKEPNIMRERLWGKPQLSGKVL